MSDANEHTLDGRARALKSLLLGRGLAPSDNAAEAIVATMLQTMFDPGPVAIEAIAQRLGLINGWPAGDIARQDMQPRYREVIDRALVSLVRDPVDAVPESTSRAPVYLVCNRCGSPDLVRDAAARWNPQAREWELCSTYDDVTCQTCEQEGHDVTEQVGEGELTQAQRAALDGLEYDRAAHNAEQGER